MPMGTHNLYTYKRVQHCQITLMKDVFLKRPPNTDFNQGKLLPVTQQHYNLIKPIPIHIITLVYCSAR